ncbi:PRA1 family protein 2 isoform X2 [Varanus komodoensis]|uniref:PRA1 family protein 2 isoform X2 n=1 Tax=Varanus komodoensis TaxID=61221 RepID=UPI001CF77D68|nr:PRA1 family protein 2 isoform X2 [Varanus komodoensis]
MSEVRLPPVRPLDDFLLGSTRLAPPDLRDLQRWHNRVINNLLYYQSNYLLVLGAGLLLGGYFCPVLTLLSGALITLMFLGFVWAAENKAPVRRFRRNNPGTCVLAILAAAYFLVSLFEGSATFLFFIALPIMSPRTQKFSGGIDYRIHFSETLGFLCETTKSDPQPRLLATPEPQEQD